MFCKLNKLEVTPDLITECLIMSHVPIPPLLSSTPPPIDFDDETDNESSLPSVLIEDDEFEDFAYATATADDHNGKYNFFFILSLILIKRPLNSAFFACNTSTSRNQ